LKRCNSLSVCLKGTDRRKGKQLHSVGQKQRRGCKSRRGGSQERLESKIRREGEELNIRVCRVRYNTVNAVKTTKNVERTCRHLGAENVTRGGERWGENPAEKDHAHKQRGERRGRKKKSQLWREKTHMPSERKASTG